ncbi:Uncharacterised protein [uncultured archaeon]|nr:Uncharacterised protein [uncultured archaeon]
MEAHQRSGFQIEGNKINISIIGGGIFVEEFLKLARQQSFIEDIHLYSESSLETDPPFFTELSYKRIAQLTGFDGSYKSIRLKTYSTIEEWADVSALNSKVIYFASGPHIKNYKDGDRNSNRINAFNRMLFERSYPKIQRSAVFLRKAIDRLMNSQKGLPDVKKIDYNKKIIVNESNPVGANSFILYMFLGGNPNRITSFDCNGLRFAKLICNRLNMLGHGKRLGLEKITLEDVEECPVIGEHHYPIPLLEDFKLRTRDNQIVGLEIVAPNFLTAAYKTGLQKELKSIAVQTMIACHKLGVGYIEAPEVAMRGLKSVVYDQKDPLVLSYSWFRDTPMLMPCEFNRERMLYEPSTKIIENNGRSKARKWYEKLGEMQKKLVENYFSYPDNKKIERMIANGS